MASHLSDVGMEFDKENFYEQMCALLEENEDKCGWRDIGDKSYLVLCIDDCIELWFPLINEKIDVSGFEIHYSASKTILELENVTIEASDEEERFGLINGETEDYPLNIMIPNLAFAPKFEEDKKYKFQVAAFAECITVYKDLEDYEKHCDVLHEDGEKAYSLGPQCFIPTGTFSPNDDDENFEQDADALIHGIVKSVERRKNSVTGNEYYYAAIDSYGACFGALIAIEDAPDLEVGNVVCGDYWLTGKYWDK